MENPLIKPYVRIRYPEWHGGLSIRESFRICLYVNRPHEEISAEVALSIETYLNAVGPGMLTWSPDETGDWLELDDSTRLDTLHQLKDKRAPGGYVLS